MAIERLKVKIASASLMIAWTVACNESNGLTGAAKRPQQAANSTNNPGSGSAVGSGSTPDTQPNDRLIFKPGESKTATDVFGPELDPKSPINNATTSDPLVATVDPKTGVITAVGPGDARITISTPDGDKVVTIHVTDATDTNTSFGHDAALNFAIQPALFVNRPACIACHAKVTGDFFTDFDNGNPNNKINDRNSGIAFMATPSIPVKVTADKNSGILVNSDGFRALAFQTMSLAGSFYIPKVTITSGDLLTAFREINPAADSITLRDALTSDMPGVADEGVDPAWYSYKALPQVGPHSGYGVDSIVELATLKINPPTPSDFANLKPVGDLVPAVGDTKISKLSDKTTVTGMSIKQGPSGPYALAKAPFSCSGDVLIVGTLVVQGDGMTIDTANSACRLYATRTVFVRGGFAASAGDSSTVQVASGIAIVAGIKNSRPIAEVDADRQRVLAEISDAGTLHLMMKQVGDKPDPLKDLPIMSTEFDVSYATADGSFAAANTAARVPACARLKSWNDPLWTRTAKFEAPDGVNCTILGEKATGFGCDPDPDPLKGQCYIVERPTEALRGNAKSVPPTVDNPAISVIEKKTANYDGVMFAAPLVHGRYHGSFRGVIVASFAIFRLADFEFVSDSRFKSANIFPYFGRQLVDLAK